jgi:mono/diheme cytochrome c family protein
VSPSTLEAIAKRAVAIHVVGLMLAAFARAATPAVDYAVHCQGCHLADGSATPGRVPALAGSVGRFARLPDGRAYLVRVPGVAQAPVGDAELAALLNWTLARFDAKGLPPGFAPYTAAEVARLRRSPLTDVDGERRRLIALTRGPRP